MWNCHGSLLSSWSILDTPTTLTVNALESWMFVGTEKGIIYGISRYYDSHESASSLVDEQSCLIFNSNDLIPITSTCLSLDEYYLISGNEEGRIIVWDINSRQGLSSIICQGIHL